MRLLSAERVRARRRASASEPGTRSGGAWTAPQRPDYTSLRVAHDGMSFATAKPSTASEI